VSAVATASPAALRAMALRLGALGYAPFPTAGKVPRTKRGLLDATPDQEQIAAWWTVWPLADIAVNCGMSAIAVVDLDTKAGCVVDEALAQLGLRDDEIVLAWTAPAPAPSARYPQSREGERGAHVIFADPDGARTGPLQIPGAEVRGVGAYIVVAPSRHPSGAIYQWHRREEPPPAAELPRLPDLVRRSTTTGAELAAAATIDVGSRHEALTAIAIRLVSRGVVEEDLVRGALLEADRCRCRPPLADDPERRAEVERIARWAITKSRVGKNVLGFAELLRGLRS
jgi:hypothetical protein